MQKMYALHGQNIVNVMISAATPVKQAWILNKFSEKI